MKKNAFFFLILFFLTAGFFLPLFDVYSQAGTAPRALEVDYPSVPGIPSVQSTISLPDYAKYIFIFSIVLSGIVALGVIIYAGFQYLTSAGMPERISDARNKISSALLGLLILFFSWLILSTINPELVALRQLRELALVPPNLAPGVYLCRNRVEIKGFWTERISFDGLSPQAQKESFEKLHEKLNAVAADCYRANTGGNVSGEFEDKIAWVYLVPAPPQTQYGVALYAESNSGGEGKILYGNGRGGNDGEGIKQEEPSEWQMPSDFLISSARPFILNFQPSSSWYVHLYKEVRFNEHTDEAGADSDRQYYPDNRGATSFLDIPGSFKPLAGSVPEIGSVKVEGSLIVVFFKDENARGNWSAATEIDITDSSLSNLNNSRMGKWLPETCVEILEPNWRNRNYPCAPGGLVIVNANFF